MELSLENSIVCQSWGLKGYKTSPTPTPHLAGNTIRATASMRNEGKTFVRRGYVLCANDDLLNLIRLKYIHCHVSFTFYVKKNKCSKNDYRCEQDSNLRGGTPLDFKSNALTTRPSQHLYVINLTLNDLT